MPQPGGVISLWGTVRATKRRPLMPLMARWPMTGSADNASFVACVLRPARP